MDLKPDIKKEKMQLNLTTIQSVGILRRGKQEEKHNRVKILLDYKKNSLRTQSYFGSSLLLYPKSNVCEPELLGSLSSDVFERRTSTGSEVFSLLTCLDDIKFVFLSFFTVIEAI